MLKQFQTFYSQLKSFEYIKLVNILADNIIKYKITLNNKTVSHITNIIFYIFHLITDSQYNDFKFQK